LRVANREFREVASKPFGQNLHCPVLISWRVSRASRDSESAS
jgi:hypothetical protein